MVIKDQSELKVVKNNGYEYIYVYFKHKGKILRFNTKYKYQKSYFTKELLFNSKFPEFESCNRKIITLKKKVDDYIKYVFQRNLANYQINQKELNDWVDGNAEKTLFGTYTFPNVSAPQPRKDKSLIDYYGEFYIFKQKELNNKPSVKDYVSLQNALLDWEKAHSKILTFSAINSLDFMVDFRHFLSETRKVKYYKTKGGLDDNKIYKVNIFKTKGGLNDNTIHKRIASLKTFMKWIEEKEIFTFKAAVLNFKSPKYENDIIALNKADIQILMEVKTTCNAHQKIIDLFIFNCFCGLRYSDLSKLNQFNFIKDEEGDYAIVQENKKTEFRVNIPIQETALKILEKYNFTLPKFSAQYFNRELKEVLKKYDVFGEPVMKKRRSLKTNKDFETIRRKLISSHTCRRTFVTLAMNANVPNLNIMSASGHTRLQTLKKYGQITQNKVAFKAIDLDTKVIELDYSI
ncbi:MAG: tyrosine-type recombinase/integrase [Prolixibacteraceae bacterium]